MGLGPVRVRSVEFRLVANARVIPDALDPAETLATEQRWLPKWGLLAVLAGILPIVAYVLTTIASEGSPKDVETVRTVAQTLTAFGAGDTNVGVGGAQALGAAHYGENASTFGLAAVALGVSALAMGPVLLGLLQAAWRRRPSFPRWFLWLPIAGGLLYGIGTMVLMLYAGSKLSDFAALPPELQTNWAASEAFTAARDDLGWLSIATILGQMFLAVGVGAAALSAMNVGLLTRLMGFLGVMVAALMILPLDPQGFLRGFWFIALGVFLLGKWPGGRPAAWTTGTPQPWPSRAEVMEAAERAREAQRSELDEPAPKPKAGAGRKRRK